MCRKFKISMTLVVSILIAFMIIVLVFFALHDSISVHQFETQCTEKNGVIVMHDQYTSICIKRDVVL